MSDWKSCPFCNGESGKSTGSLRSGILYDYIECLECSATAPIDIWNTRKHPPASEWQPIESAPKDGTKVDLWLEFYASPASMGMSDSFRMPECYYATIEGKTGWFHLDGMKQNQLFDEYEYITHWMPLPEPPKEI